MCEATLRVSLEIRRYEHGKQTGTTTYSLCITYTNGMVDVPVDEAMMRLALEQARLAAVRGEVPVGAVIYRGDEVLAAAHNLRETDADPTAHAEIVALRLAAQRIGRWRLDGCVMAVTLEPCPMCAGALINSRMSRLVYGAADPKMGAVDTLYDLCRDGRFNHRLAVTGGVLADECAHVLQAFFQARRPVREAESGSATSREV